MTFMSNLEQQLHMAKKITENGAVGYKTSGKELLDMNFAVGSMRDWEDAKIISQFTKAYYENQLLAVKWLFYSRDIRGNGMGERRIFRVCFKWLVENHFDYVVKVIALIPEYGRFDDMFCLLDTQAKAIVMTQIKEQLDRDITAMNNGERVSLLAKWLPSCNTSSYQTRQLGQMICSELGLTQKEYRKTLSKLRAYIDVVEVKMSAKDWSEIDYSKLPSRANLLYGKAFMRNDEDRRTEYLVNLSNGDVKINASTLFPSDIVNKYYGQTQGWRKELLAKDETLEGLWNALPDYVGDDSNTLVVRDGSGSMTTTVGNSQVRALDISTALTIYFAEHCKGEFHNKFITFSSKPQMIDMTNASCLRDKLEICDSHQDCTNTDIKAVFNLILQTAIDNHLSQNELPKNILIVSDMEFDNAMSINRWSNQKPDLTPLFEQIRKEYKTNGYSMPRLVFWNVCSRTNTIPLQENKLGVALVSGFNPAVYNMVLSNELDPYKCLLVQINSERYDIIENALCA